MRKRISLPQAYKCINTSQGQPFSNTKKVGDETQLIIKSIVLTGKPIKYKTVCKNPHSSFKPITPCLHVLFLRFKWRVSKTMSALFVISVTGTIARWNDMTIWGSTNLILFASLCSNLIEDITKRSRAKFTSMDWLLHLGDETKKPTNTFDKIKLVVHPD